ncbi:hypothetical protein [Pseudomonas protegens]|uniref:hypothetical protein n=1 Tax=Pseudomonas protegens TaxID=380021 RepID=UPI0015E7723B|nr:hypothetical protein [Pseudomonas protegens]
MSDSAPIFLKAAVANTAIYNHNPAIGSTPLATGGQSVAPDDVVCPVVNPQHA